MQNITNITNNSYFKIFVSLSVCSLLVLGILSYIKISGLESVGILGGTIMISVVLVLIMLFPGKKRKNTQDIPPPPPTTTAAAAIPPTSNIVKFPPGIYKIIAEHLSMSDIFKLSELGAGDIPKYVSDKAKSCGYDPKKTGDSPQQFLAGLLEDIKFLYDKHKIPGRFIAATTSLLATIDKILEAIQSSNDPFTINEIVSLYVKEGEGDRYYYDDSRLQVSKYHYFSNFLLYLATTNSMTCDISLFTELDDLPMFTVRAWTALCNTISHNDIAGIKVLILHGANPNIMFSSRAPLCSAIDREHLPMLRFLVTNNIHSKSKVSPNSIVLHYESHYDSATAAPSARYLNQQYTALMYACKHNRINSARTLIELGADVNRGGNHAATPLSVATSKEMRKLLLQHGAKK